MTTGGEIYGLALQPRGTRRMAVQYVCSAAAAVELTVKAKCRIMGPQYSPNHCV
jgi:hypothetical protein